MHRLQTPAQLGAYLRSLRKARGLSQRQLGEIFGVTAMRISAIERNPESVGFAQLMRILSVLGARIYLDDGAPRTVAERSAAPHNMSESRRGGEW